MLPIATKVRLRFVFLSVAVMSASDVGAGRFAEVLVSEADVSVSQRGVMVWNFNFIVKNRCRCHVVVNVIKYTYIVYTPGHGLFKDLIF